MPETFNANNKKVVRTYELQPEYRPDVIKRLLIEASADATKSSKQKKTYVVIYTDR